MRCRTVKIVRRNGCRPAVKGKNKCRRIQFQHAEIRGERPLTGSEPSAESKSKVARRWTVIASGLLILALALVVIYTGPNAFYSPVALVTVAAIGLGALLLQVWFRRDFPNVNSPLWLNVLGILCAMVSLFGDYFHLSRAVLEMVAFAAVVCFGISGSLILHTLRRRPRQSTDLA